MKVKKINASSKKTSEKIKESFVQLLNEKKELSSITVTELVKKADITRSSFYTHYDNIYDVAKDIQDETIELFLNKDIEFNSLEDVYKYIDNMIVYLKENEEYYRMILSSNDTIFYFEKIRIAFVNKINNLLVKSGNKNEYLKLDVEFFLEGLLYQIIKYFRTPNYYSIEEIGNRVKIWLNKLFF